jgi:hypothetical protein
MDRAARPSKIVLRAFGSTLAGNVRPDSNLANECTGRSWLFGEIRKIDARFSDRFADAVAGVQFTVAPPQHRLYFLPEPQGHGSFGPVVTSSPD